MAKALKKKIQRNRRSATQTNDFPTAKVFQNGRSQAVRLPKEFRFEGSEIGVGRVGNSVILYPLDDPWAIFFEGAKELSEMDELVREQAQPVRKRFSK